MTTTSAPREAAFGWRRPVRFLGSTLVVALLYIGLEEAWQALPGVLSQRGWLSSLRTGVSQSEVQHVAADSAARELMLTPQHRQAAWALGFNLGFMSEVLGSLAMSDASKQALARQALAEREARSRTLAAFLGVPDAAVLAAYSVTDFTRLTQRIEADENGVAARIEALTTPRHKHLYMLGMFVGMTAAEFDLSGDLDWTPTSLIARHATLAGVPEYLWAPLARAPQGVNPRQIGQSYHGAADALGRALADPNLFTPYSADPPPTR